MTLVAHREPPPHAAKVVAAIALAMVAALPLVLGDFASFVGARIAVTALIGLSVIVVTGYTGQLSLMPYTFVGIGVFTAAHAITVWGWPFWFAALLAAAATLPLSVFVGALSVRLRGFYLAIATLTFASAAGTTLFHWDWLTGGQRGLPVTRPSMGPIDITGDGAFYLLCLAAALAAVWMVLGLERSRLGRAMVAVRESEVRAAALGINPVKTKLAAFVISGMIAGVGGVFHAMLLQHVTRTPFQSPFVEVLGVTLVILVVVGGVGSPWGAFLGAAVISVQQEVFRTAVVLQFAVAAAAAAALVFTLLKAPGGLAEIVGDQATMIRRPTARNGMWIGAVAVGTSSLWMLVQGLRT